MNREFRQVDVFGDALCSGNPVAVVLDAEGLDDDALRAFSVWTNLSECTFILPPTVPGADYRVRIFNLSLEIPFAGHPTLGTARAWLEAGGVPATPGVVMQQSEIGVVPVRVDSDRLSFAAPPLLRSGPVDDSLLDDLVEILRVDRERVVDAAWLDNGPGWVGVLLDSAQTVLDLVPDVAGHPGRWDIGVIGAHDSGCESAFELRAFFSENGEPLREDPVTGSLNASAAEWLIASGRAHAPFIASQGAAMGRNGRIHVTSDDAGLWIGGQARTVVAGVIDL